MALITTINHITASLDTGKNVIGLVLDLRKAFDTVDYEILLQKFFKLFKARPLRYYPDSIQITRLGCGGSNTNKTVCSSLLELMTVSAQSGFNSWGVQQQHALLSAKKSIHAKPVLIKWDIAVGEVAFYKAHRLRRFHKRGPLDMAHVIV
ncbi:hypothetical protein CAPTEDRAFT_186138 [Capitella teleta]|uniref:Reverse transcriptase domain-containing protein n=1 Tax=Capitella teleta TaxID=283909 RepID=R7UBV3_CAPTE|nr:hypothetical protein CAPTEDRAFT_186138 [Capitella teleta]|eukprot:ELU03586.1 hypothetical protein CAPTEDRAFT_186138 [Capitella teleta]